MFFVHFDFPRSKSARFVHCLIIVASHVGVTVKIRLVGWVLNAKCVKRYSKTQVLAREAFAWLWQQVLLTFLAAKLGHDICVSTFLTKQSVWKKVPGQAPTGTYLARVHFQSTKGPRRTCLTCLVACVSMHVVLSSKHIQLNIIPPRNPTPVTPIWCRSNVRVASSWKKEPEVISCG